MPRISTSKYSPNVIRNHSGTYTSDSKLYEELILRVVRPAGAALGISISGGVGSTPYRTNDYVRSRGFYLFIPVFCCLCDMKVEWLGCQDLQSRSRGFDSQLFRFYSMAFHRGHVIYIVPLSPSSIICCWPKGTDTL